MLSPRRYLPGLCLLVSLAPAYAQEPLVQPQPDQVAKAAEAVRDATIALRNACVSLPSSTVVPLPSPEDSKPPRSVARPYANEEAVCLMVQSPEQAFMPYFWMSGLMGGLLALFGLGFFVYVGGIVRALWLAPMRQLGSVLPFKKFPD
jgi:hypothetical protein